jgi:hypothetical protein
MSDDKRIDPKDVASATAVGAASRLGVARAKQKGQSHALLGDEMAAGAAAGAAKSKARKATAGASSVVGTVVFVGLLVAMLALMMFMSGR